MAWLNRVLPHEQFILGLEGSDPGALPKIWLFVIAITIHNFPEGMAVGIGFGGGGDMANGIGLQNAPEGWRRRWRFWARATAAAALA